VVDALQCVVSDCHPGPVYSSRRNLVRYAFSSLPNLGLNGYTSTRQPPTTFQASVMIRDQVPTQSLAYLHDIPGSRCGPEDGPWPRSYQVLDSTDILRELSALAKPQNWTFSTYDKWRKVDTLNFQPCPRTRTQDRYVVQQLDIHGKQWTLTGVFDG
jgi:hypothetical protein